MNIIDNLADQIRGKKIKIVFPEGEDLRILSAVSKLACDDIIAPIVLGNPDVINNMANDNGLDMSDVYIVNYKTSSKLRYYANELMKLRNGKESYEQANCELEDANYFGAIMVFLEEADGMVSGAAHSSAETIRPILKIIGTKTGISRASGSMLMLGPNNQKYLYADIAVNINPAPADIAEIAIESANTAKLFDIDPRIAMLSFSTNGSVKSAVSSKTIKATKIAKKLSPELIIDGEMQFDAALVPTIGHLKMPNSKVAGAANVFIFPDIQSGNIAYKITQHLAGFEALGPIIQGLSKPANDLSRACSEEDIYKLAIITAIQSVAKMK